MSVKQIIITIICIVGLLCGAGYCVYNWGYNTGVQDVEAEVTQLNEQHKQVIATLQNQHDQAVQQITNRYVVEVDQLNQQVIALQQDKQQYDQYIGSYIPQQQYNYVPNGFVVWHDRAAKGERLDKIVLQGQLDDSSKYTFNDAMYAIGYNYSQANVCYKRLDALQTIVKNFMEKQK